MTTDAAEKARPRLLAPAIVAASVIAIGASALGVALHGEHPKRPAPVVATGVTVNGVVVLAGPGFTNGAECAGSGTYADVHQGTQITVTSAGATVALGVLLQGTGQKIGADTVCWFSYVVPNVPTGHGSYTIAVGSRPGLGLTEADLFDTRSVEVIQLGG